MTRSYFTLEDSVVVHAKQVDLQPMIKVSQLGNNNKPDGLLNSQQLAFWWGFAGMVASK